MTQGSETFSRFKQSNIIIIRCLIS